MPEVIFLDQYGGTGGGQVVLAELLRQLAGGLPCRVLSPPGAFLDTVRRAAPAAAVQPWEPALRLRPLTALLRVVRGPAPVVVVNGQRALLPALLVKGVRAVTGRRTCVVLVVHSRGSSALRRLAVQALSWFCDVRVLVARCLDGLVSGPAVVLPLGVRPQDLVPVDDARSYRAPRRVKAMGRDDPVKGLDLFPLAARRLHESGRCRATQFALALSASLEDPSAVRSGADPDVLVEPAGPKDISWIEPDDVLVVPSRSEAACLTAQEAMARGAIVVAAAVGDIPDFVIDGQTGFLFAAGDVEALASAIERAVTLDEAAGLRLRAAARAVVEERAGTWYDAMTQLLTALHDDERARA